MVNKHDVKRRMRQLMDEYIHEPQQPDYVLDESEMMVHIGPQHPIQPGPFLIDLKLKGETVETAKLYMGYGHKGIEKILEGLTYIQGLPVTDRICYLSALSNNEAYVSSVERLLDIEPPERSQYIRVIMQELSRIQSHLLGIGEYATDLGFVTMFLYMIREREYVLGLIEDITGARITHAFPRFGGVREDIPDGWREKAVDVLAMVNEKCEMYKELFSDDSVYKMRTVGIGTLTKEDVIKVGLTGPALRAAGIDYDVRRVYPTLTYPDIDFKVQTAKNGDIFDRVMVRIAEIQESCWIIEQALDQMKPGPLFPEGLPFGRRTPSMRVPPGEAYVPVEDPRGEMAMYIRSDGTDKPYRVKIRGPAFSLMQGLPPMLENVYIADVPAIAASMDSCNSEADR